MVSRARRRSKKSNWLIGRLADIQAIMAFPGLLISQRNLSMLKPGGYRTSLLFNKLTLIFYPESRATKFSKNSVNRCDFIAMIPDKP